MHSPQRPVGALPDQLRTGYKPSSAPERFSPICTAHHRPLPGSGLPLQSHTCSALALNWEADALYHQGTKDPGRYRPPVCGYLRGYSQAILSGTPPPGVDRKPGVSSTPGLRHAGAGMRHSGAPEHSSVRSKQVFRRTGAKGRPRRSPRWSNSSLPI